MHRGKLPARRMAGLSYVEVLIATALIAMALVPAIEALAPAVQGTVVHETQTVQQFHLAGRLESLLAEPFAALDAQAVAISNPTVASTVYSDAAGTTNRRLVYLSRYDADNADGDDDFFTGTDAGLVWVRVEIAGTARAIEGLTSAYD